jgi:hypothetical protein
VWPRSDGLTTLGTQRLYRFGPRDITMVKALRTGGMSVSTSVRFLVFYKGGPLVSLANNMTSPSYTADRRKAK